MLLHLTSTMPINEDTVLRLKHEAARNVEAAIRHTHVRVGDHSPEPRHKHEAVAYCVFCKREHAGGRICMGHYP